MKRRLKATVVQGLLHGALTLKHHLTTVNGTSHKAATEMRREYMESFDYKPSEEQQAFVDTIIKEHVSDIYVPDIAVQTLCTLPYYPIITAKCEGGRYRFAYRAKGSRPVENHRDYWRLFLYDLVKGRLENSNTKS